MKISQISMDNIQAMTFNRALSDLQDEARRQFPEAVGVRFTLRDSEENLFLIGSGGMFETGCDIQEVYPKFGKTKREKSYLKSDKDVDFDGKTLTFDDMSFRLEVAVTFAADKFKI